ncbi:hypothetical protein D3C80_1533890 [compost metagenome]
MKLSNLIQKQNPAMRLRHRSRLGLRHTRHAHCSCSLVYRVMHGADQRIGNPAFIKTGRCRIYFCKLRITLKRRKCILLGFLHHNTGCRSLADSRRSVDDHMLGIRAAQRCL